RESCAASGQAGERNEACDTQADVRHGLSPCLPNVFADQQRSRSDRLSASAWAAILPSNSHQDRNRTPACILDIPDAPPRPSLGAENRSVPDEPTVRRHDTPVSGSAAPRAQIQKACKDQPRRRSLSI